MSEKCQQLIELLIEYVNRERGLLEKNYCWSIPGDAPVEYDRSGYSVDRNLDLRAKLAAEWKRNPEKRLELATWYVRKWGGIPRIKADTLRQYVEASDEQLVEGPLHGVASWSKVLALRNPQHYFIFDARVVTALNALQLRSGMYESVCLFPSLPSRNKKIAGFSVWVRSNRSGAGIFARANAYAEYLRVVRDVARCASIDPEKVEMMLFANAENLAGGVMVPSTIPPPASQSTRAP